MRYGNLCDDKSPQPARSPVWVATTNGNTQRQRRNGATRHTVYCIRGSATGNITFYIQYFFIQLTILTWLCVGYWYMGMTRRSSPIGVLRSDISCISLLTRPNGIINYHYMMNTKLGYSGTLITPVHVTAAFCTLHEPQMTTDDA
jgi:hypothetical protein